MGKAMRIKISSNAACIYARQFTGASPLNIDWMRTLSKVEGKWLEVETKYLFKDQFNTVPVPGVSETGLRIMESCVDEIENDVRREIVKCQYCGEQNHWNKWYFKSDEKAGAFCPSCNRAGYANPLHGMAGTALNMKSHGLKLRGLGVKSYEESWYATICFSNNEKIKKMSDEDLLIIVGWSYYYGGPGRAFAHEPWVQRKEKVVMVKQGGGLDI